MNFHDLLTSQWNGSPKNLPNLSDFTAWNTKGEIFIGHSIACNYHEWGVKIILKHIRGRLIIGLADYPCLY